MRPMNDKAEEAAILQGRVMKKIFGSISAIALAALIAGTVTILPSFSDKVVASANP